MKSLIEKLILEEEFTVKDIADELNKICESVHSSCDSGCPVYNLNKGTVNPETSKHGCSYFKNGFGMLNFIYNYHTNLTK